MTATVLLLLVSGLALAAACYGLGRFDGYRRGYERGLMDGHRRGQKAWIEAMENRRGADGYDRVIAVRR